MEKVTDRKDRHLDPDKLYSVDEMAPILKTNSDYIRNMMKEGKIPFVVVRNRPTFCGWQIKEWLDSIRRGPEIRNKEVSI